MMPLVVLLHLCDSLFPLGTFGYSDGLEAAASAGLIRTPGDLREWLDVCLEQSIGSADGPAVYQSWTAFNNRDWTTLCRLDAEGHALRPSAGARRASRATGWRLATTWQALYPDCRLEELLGHARSGALGPALPVAFGCACASAGVDACSTTAAFAYTRLAATISAAMRLLPIGQGDAHALLAGMVRRIPAAVEDIARRTTIDSFAPAMDIAVMAQPHLHSRLFRT
jgi:urease accessory protein